MRPQLLCTFTHMDRLSVCIDIIYETYSIEAVDNIKCYHYIESSDNVICIYNIYTNSKRLKDTISINRKKETNTLYSINALNGLIRSLNNGVLDKSYLIDWSNFTSCLLLAEGDSGYKSIKIKELAQ